MQDALPHGQRPPRERCFQLEGERLGVLPWGDAPVYQAVLAWGEAEAHIGLCDVALRTNIGASDASALRLEFRSDLFECCTMERLAARLVVLIDSCIQAMSAGETAMDNSVWHPEVWGRLLAPSLRDVSVGPPYLARPTGVRRAAPADLCIGGVCW